MKSFSSKTLIKISIIFLTNTQILQSLAKGYMALKSDLGYEAEHQRPQRIEEETANISQRTTIQNYRVDAYPHHSDFEQPEALQSKDIEEQTYAASADNPYEGAYE